MKLISRHMRARLAGYFRIPAASLAIILLVVIMTVSANDSGGREAFRKGKNNLETGRYADAVLNLLIAQKEFSLLEDYALLYLAEAYHNLGEHGKADDAVKTLLERHPTSPLIKKARMAEIRETADRREETLVLYGAYVRDFPEDMEAFFTYAQLLKKNGEKDKATSAFRRIYIKAGHLSSAARAELSEDISTSDMLEHAASLMKQYDFEDAEKELKRALAKCTGKNRHEILKSLAYALFKQKKYREAAELYGQVNDLLYRARSLYRSGDRKGFEAALNSLAEKNDKRAGFLFLTVAADRRREKDFDRALQIYQEVLNKYPSDAEEALWGTGWTQYLSGRFRDAAETFAQLQGKYADPKYLYWQGRSKEAAGEDASTLYAKLLSSDGNGFYAALTYARGQRMLPRLSSLNQANGKTTEPVVKSRAAERIEALISLDMRTEAITELAASCRNSASLTDLLYCISKFQELGDFKRSITQATKIPYSEKVHRLWYPLAFWDKVEQASRRYELDPLIVLSVMREESRFDQSVKSPAGAYGLMQLMPQTAYRLDRSLNLGIHRPAQLTDPGVNIHLGTFYLKSLQDEFRSFAHTLAAYNAGEAAVRNWQSRFAYRSADEFIEDIPYTETRNYVKKVITSYYQYKRGSLTDQEKEIGIDLITGKI